MEEKRCCGVDGDFVLCVWDDPEYTALDCDYASKWISRDDCKHWRPEAAKAYFAAEEVGDDDLRATVAALRAERDTLAEDVARLKGIVTAMEEGCYKCQHPKKSEELALTIQYRDCQITALKQVNEESRIEVARLREERDVFKESYRLAMVSVNDAYDKGKEAATAQLATERERGRLDGIRECIDEAAGCWSLGSAVSALQSLAIRALPTKEER